MKKLSLALKAHLSQPYQTMSTCWLVVRVDGTVFAFTGYHRSQWYFFIHTDVKGGESEIAGKFPLFRLVE